MKTPILILVMMVCSCLAFPAGPCPRFWVHFRGYCYRYFGDRLSFADAENRCHDYFTGSGMARLASVHDLDENSFLYELFRSAAGDTPDWPGSGIISGSWIGLHQETSDGPWVYTDGTPFDYSKWRPGQPDGLTAEDCGHLWRTNDVDDNNDRQMWNDISCNVGIAYTCKMPADIN